MLEENDDLKLSHMRNSGLVGAAIPALDSGPELPDFTHIYKQAPNCEPNVKCAQEFKFSKKKYIISSDPFFKEIANL